ncbi:MAG: hypothetical protein ACXWZP_08100 [Gaiellaceae bacterium]
MKRLLLAIVVGAVLVPVASAGGWATVQLSDVPADGIKAGTSMGIDITVLQHGRTPLEGVTPVFQVLDLSSGEVVRSVNGTPTGRPGVYHVDVSFPREGTFSYQVLDGFVAYGGARTHTYAPVEIAEPGGSGSPSWVGVALTALALLIVAAATVAVLGARHRSAPVTP